jgi:hypothetical protein
MSDSRCPKCGHAVRPGFSYCPNCQANLIGGPTAEPADRQVPEAAAHVCCWPGAIILGLFILVFLAVVGFCVVTCLPHLNRR